MSEISRRLVITADDYGYDEETCKAIRSLLGAGYIDTTTVIALEPNVDQEVGKLPRDLPVGLHFVLNSDPGREPWFAASASRSHNTSETEESSLPTDQAEAEALFSSEQVSEELEAQYELLVNAGANVARLDSHSGTLYGLHGNPLIETALTFCAKHDLAFRLPRSFRMFFGNQAPEGLTQMHAQAVQLADMLGVRLPEEIASNPFPASVIGSYEALRDYYIGLLPQFPAGTSELFLHPSEDTEWARKRFGSDWMKRVWEMRLLSDPLWRESLKNEGIETVNAW